jgi:hypothetical protein
VSTFRDRLAGTIGQTIPLDALAVANNCGVSTYDLADAALAMPEMEWLRALADSCGRRHAYVPDAIIQWIEGR